jgi:hypothetical protein
MPVDLVGIVTMAMELRGLCVVLVVTVTLGREPEKEGAAGRMWPI